MKIKLLCKAALVLCFIHASKSDSTTPELMAQSTSSTTTTRNSGVLGARTDAAPVEADSFSLSTRMPSNLHVQILGILQNCKILASCKHN